MSYRTNRKTGGTFRTHDYTPSELASQTRRFHCARCEAMLGEDVSPSVAAMESQTTGHEVAGSPISTFLTRRDLNEHIRMVHGGLRRADTATRHLGKRSSPAQSPRTMTDSESLTPEKEDVGGERNFLDSGDTVFGEGEGVALVGGDEPVVRKKKVKVPHEDFYHSESEDEPNILGGDESVTGEGETKEGEFFP